MQRRFALHVNKKRKEASLLKKRDKVYLLTKNLKKKGKNKKLNLIKVDAFFIKEVKESKTYKLNLLKNVKIFKTFNVFLLKLINFNVFI